VIQVTNVLTRDLESGSNGLSVLIRFPAT